MADGLIFGTGDITVKVGAGADITLGVLQNVSFTIATSQAELRGGSSKFPVKVVTTSRNITGSAEFAKMDPEALQVFLGGTLTTATATTLAIKDNDATVEFKLTLKNPTDGSEVTCVLYRCISTNFAMAFSNENFLIPSFEFTAMADATGKVMDITLPDPT